MHITCFHCFVGLKRKLLEHARKAKTRELMAWVKSISHHFWYCCASCGGVRSKLSLSVPKRKSEWATLEVGCRLPTQSEARNDTGIFYSIFRLTEQKITKFSLLLIGWERHMFGWAQPTPAHSYRWP